MNISESILNLLQEYIVIDRHSGIGQAKSFSGKTSTNTNTQDNVDKKENNNEDHDKSSNKNLYSKIKGKYDSLSPRVKTGGKLAGLAAATLASYGGYKHFTKTPTEKAVHAAGSIKDVIKNKISENPKAAMAAGGAAAALGAGYGTYKYLKNRKK